MSIEVQLSNELIANALCDSIMQYQKSEEFVNKGSINWQIISEDMNAHGHKSDPNKCKLLWRHLAFGIDGPVNAKLDDDVDEELSFFHPLEAIERYNKPDNNTPHSSIAPSQPKNLLKPRSSSSADSAKVGYTSKM